MPENIENTSANPVLDKDIEMLQRTLGVLEIALENVLNDVGISKSFLQAGVLTEFSIQLKEDLKDPAKKIMELRKDIDRSLSLGINKAIGDFFNAKLEIINSVYKSKSESELYYNIQLKEDSFENRDAVFAFLHAYNASDFADVYPVYFQISATAPKEKPEFVKVI